MGLQGRSKNRERMKTSNLLKVNVEDILKSKQRMNGLQSTGFETYILQHYWSENLFQGEHFGSRKD